MSSSDSSSTEVTVVPVQTDDSHSLPGASFVRAVLHGISRWLRVRGRRLVRTWHRSLQFRVAATTVVVTSLIVLLIGLFLVDQISNGVLKAKRNAAIAQASAGLDPARSYFVGVSAGDLNGIRQAADQLTADLTATGKNAGLFAIVVRSPDGNVDKGLAPGLQVPQALRSVVQSGAVALQYAQIVMPNQTRSESGLIVGEPVASRAGSFELYYIFPLEAEAETISLVQRTVLLAGFALVLLVAMIAMLVTRQVVRPVRVAAQTAGRLADGDLAQRITVVGEDDIARLAMSFNNMATSLQHQIERLEHLSRLQQQFTADVSHELRTPLTTVRMAAELLYQERSAFAPEVSRSVELLNNELDRFENLLADLLEISRHDAGAAQLEIERADLVAVVENSVSACAPLARRHGVELRCELGGQPIYAEIDPRRVDRILRNLVANALDHAEGNPVTIQLGADEHAVAVSVQDRGIGLRPGEANLVFNRFWRGDPSRSRLTGGTGLGLAISLEDARLHGGWLHAWGERGYGSTFRLTLPRRTGEPLHASPLPLTPTEVDV